MNYKDQILKIIEDNNGYITTKKITENDIPKIYLTQLVKEKKLTKVRRGLYMLPNCFEDEYYKFQTMSRYCVFSLETALYLHNYCDRIPTVYNITVPRNYNGYLSKEKNVQLSYASNELFDLGIIELETPYGQKVKVYDLEKTICDIVKNKEKIDPEIFSKALKQYVKEKNKNLNNLISYSRKLNVEKEIRTYLEVLL